MVRVTVPQGHVGLVLLQNRHSSFHLRIPLEIINELCLRPRKYLRYLGWCILGIEGEVVEDISGVEIGNDGGLTSRMIYRYVPKGELDLAGIIDLEVIKTRTNVPSETTQTRDDFCARLLERDVRCVWTGIPSSMGGDGLHIIPFKRGSEWLQQIIANRPNYDENVTTLNYINDIRNGIFASPVIRPPFDARLAVILKTPNHVLEREDVPERADRNIAADVAYPPHTRYTLQWLKMDEYMLNTIPNNCDATFKRGTRRNKPSDLLLHYNYGAAAVKIWGQNTTVLKRLAEPPRPEVPAPPEAGPSRTLHDRSVVIGKRKAAPEGASARGKGKTRAKVKSEEAEWNEDDVMLFFWGNTKAARERRLNKANEDARRIEEWRGSVPQGSA